MSPRGTHEWTSGLGALRSRFDPWGDEGAERLLSVRHARAAFTRMSCPSDQVVVREMLMNLDKRAVAVACGILQLRADLPDGEPLLHDFARLDEEGGRSLVPIRYIVGCRLDIDEWFMPLTWMFTDI